ncbi:MAG: hypothetical protein U0793_26225 [Gemmataceae bacterium]
MILGLLGLAQGAWAQQSLRIESVRVGYEPLGSDNIPRMKVGMWAPVHVTLAAGKEGAAAARIQIETNDSEDAATVYTIEAPPLIAGASRTFLGYTRTGNLGSGVKVSVVQDGRTVAQETTSLRAPNLGSLLVLSAGGKIDALEGAMEMMSGKVDPLSGDHILTKFAAMETEATSLPELGFGYDGVDLVILCGGETFLKELSADSKRLEALSSYVRNGGHLVVPIAPAQQALVHDLLAAKAWSPPLPVVPPRASSGLKSRRLFEVESWAQAEGRPFEDARGNLSLATLDPGGVAPGVWDVFVRAETGAGRAPLLARMPYGLGNITLVAFSLDEGPFTKWSGRREFLKALITKLTPREASVSRETRDLARTDIAAELQRTLDQFDVPVVSFGLVAFFIIVYILVIAALDYFVLKLVFGRLERTWLTFPVIVIAATIAAYYTAALLKGHEQRINQVDLVDVDLRTNVKAYVVGRSFFTLFSPEIRPGTVGLIPDRNFWAESPLRWRDKAAQVSWFGRPDAEAWGMGRRSSQGIFRKPYSYAAEARGLEKVPLGRWSTKSFQATWEHSVEVGGFGLGGPYAAPFHASLFYHQKPVAGRDVILSGTFRNNLPVDLLDVWFIYGDRALQLDRAIPADAEVKVSFDTGRDLGAWASIPDAPEVGADFGAGKPRFDATSVVKAIMFHDKTRFGGAQNHALRNLDQSWRLEGKLRAVGTDTSLHEVIVYARLKQRHGKAADIVNSKDQPLPTRLWLGALPGAGTPPEIEGTLTHDTYLRIYLPVHPAEKTP